MTKRNWFGYGIYFYAAAAIAVLCFHLIHTEIDFFRTMLTPGCGNCKGYTFGETIHNLTYRIPAFFIFPALALWGARCQLRPRYLSMRLLTFGFVVWSLILLSFWGWIFIRSLRSGY